MFTPEDRDRVYRTVVAWAKTDPRIAAGAVVGSLAEGLADRWSDLDLTFAVRDGAEVEDVLERWSERLRIELDALRLFDVSFGGAIYRVFLLPGCLQFDLSFAPAAQFGAIGPRFRLLFGTAVQKPFAPDPSAEYAFGSGVHHIVRARVCIERGRYWQAEYWISAARDQALTLACLRRGLPAHFARSFDDLPNELLASARDALVRSLEASELLRACRSAARVLLGEAQGTCELAKSVERRLGEFLSL